MADLGDEDPLSAIEMRSHLSKPTNYQFSSSVAQLVEHRTVNPLVPGSIPGRGAGAKCIPCLLGPSCAGKTFVASSLINALPVSIINIDPGLAFREMDVGTAKPDCSEEYFLVDIISPNEMWSSFRFKGMARNLIPKIIAEGRVPIISGGSFFYYKVLVEALNGVSIKNRYFNSIGFINSRCDAQLQPNWLNPTRCNLQSARVITRNILKIFLQVGVTILHFCTEQTVYKFLPLILFPSDLNILRNRITLRLTNMINDGLVEEVIFLRRKYRLSSASHCMRLIGYKQAWNYLSGSGSYGLMINSTLASTFALVKRQLGWLKSFDRYIALNCCQPQQQLLQSAIKAVGQFV